MQFISAGAVKRDDLRRLAIQHLFLFDSTVDKATVRTAIALKNAAPECRSCTHTLTGDVLAATPVSGVKGNKFYPAHTGNINHFNVASNGNWFFKLSSNDGFTTQDHADKFVTVSDSPVKNGWMTQDANMMGTATGYSRNNVAMAARSYFFAVFAYLIA